MTSGLNTKEAELITLVTATNEKLDQIIGLLGAAPPAPQHTLDDLYAILSDIHQDTVSIDQKLLAIRNYIKDPEEAAIVDDYSSLLWNIYLLRKGTVIEPGEGPLEEIQHITSQLTSFVQQYLYAVDAHIVELKNFVFYAFRSLGISVDAVSYDYQGYIHDTLELAQLLQGSTGLPIHGLEWPEKGQRNIIQLLERIATRPVGDIGGGLEPSEVCDNPYVSTGMILVPSLFEAWPSTVWATFSPPLPSGVSFGTIFGLSVDNSELQIVDNDWSGWSIYVASSANNFGVYVGEDINLNVSRFPCNTWLDLGFLNTSLSVFVGGNDSLRVWLCNGAWGAGGGGGGPWGGGGGGGGPWDECTELTSVPATVTHPNSNTTSINHIPMSEFPNTSYTNSLSVSTGGAFSTNTPDYAAVANWNGVSFKLLSGSGVRVVAQRSDLSFITYGFSGVNDVYTIPENCIKVVVDDFTGGSTAQFEVRICPPGITP